LSRIGAKFEELSRKDEGALIAFVTAGDPTIEDTVRIAKALEGSGTDMIELGLSFSDPIADGPTIQAASERALKAGMNPDVYFNLTKKIRKSVRVPLICLTYFNPVLKRGINRFMRDCNESGIDGVIIPDLPVEEAKEVVENADDNGVDTIFLATPTTTDERMKKILNSTRGFVYLVSLLGVTGARQELSKTVKEVINRARTVAKKEIPLAVGFGISTPKHVREVIASGADGAIVGSAIVDIIAKNIGDKKRMLRELERFGKTLKAATRSTHPQS
jgi:tryptophan synthase alpha chain